jgi:hypothetical protein
LCIIVPVLFKKSYQPRTNLVKDNKGDLFADSQTIVALWRNNFSQLFDVYGVNYVRQTEIHTTELLVPQPIVFEFELAVENLKRHKSPGIDQIPLKNG